MNIFGIIRKKFLQILYKAEALIEAFVLDVTLSEFAEYKKQGKKNIENYSYSNRITRKAKNFKLEIPLTKV